MSDDYPGGWFGESWGAPVCEEERHKPTPVGDRCIDCAGEILSTDQGMIIPFAGMRPAVLGAHHLDCFLKSVVPGHLLTSPGKPPERGPLQSEINSDWQDR